MGRSERFGGVKRFFEDAAGTISGAIEDAVSAATSFFADLGESIGDTLGEAGKAILDFIAGICIAEAVKEAVEESVHHLDYLLHTFTVKLTALREELASPVAIAAPPAGLTPAMTTQISNVYYITFEGGAREVDIDRLVEEVSRRQREELERYMA